jgi:hypothetical protein
MLSSYSSHEITQLLIKIFISISKTKKIEKIFNSALVYTIIILLLLLLLLIVKITIDN